MDEKENEIVVFEKFTTTMALQLHSYIAAYASEHQLPVCVRIVWGERLLLHFCPIELSADKDNWLRRKTKTVMQFGMSTQALYQKCKGNEVLLEEKYGYSRSEMTLTPGGVPLLIRDMGCLGALAVSGMQPAEDHQLAMEALRWLDRPEKIQSETEVKINEKR